MGCPPDALGHAPGGGRRFLLILLPVLLAAALLRGWGIDREPLWVDEVYTVRASGGGVSRILVECARDVHPPGFFLGVAAFRAAFGSSPGALRAYSAVWSLLGVAAIALLALELTRSRVGAALAGLLAAVHPLAIYYAQEARSYAQAAALGTVAAWLLWRWLAARRAGRTGLGYLGGYTLVAILLLYSHYLGALLLVGQGLPVLIWLWQERDRRGVVGYLGAAVVSGLALLPWLVWAFGNADHLSHRMLPSLTPPALLEIARAFVGDLVFGLARWGERGPQLRAAAACLLAVTATIWAVRVRLAPGRRQLVYPAWLALAPLALVVAASHLVHPIYRGPKFDSLILPGFLVLLAVTACQLPRPLWRSATAAAFGALMLAATVAQHRQLTKQGLVEFASYYRQVEAPDFVAFFPSYHSVTASYLLGPRLGNARATEIVEGLRGERPSTIWVASAAGFDAVVTPEQRRFRDWLLELGPHGDPIFLSGLEITPVRAAPLPRVYPPYQLGRRLGFGDASTEPYLWLGWYPAKDGHRWSRGTEARIVFSVDEDVPSLLRLRMLCFGRQRIGIELNSRPVAEFECDRATRLHERELPLPELPATTRYELRFSLPDAISPAELQGGTDRRRLALGVEWLEIR